MATAIRQLRASLRNVILTATLLIAVATDGRSEDYGVGPGDKLNVSILGKEEFSGPVEVREDGTIRLHKIGEIAVSGRTLGEIEDMIVAKAKVSFDESISVVLSIAEYRPVFVMGAVGAPGSYPYSPGLTVIKVIALAGGYEKYAEDGSNERFIIDAKRRAMDAQTRLDFAKDEQAAIVAELESLDHEVSETGQTADTEANREQIEFYRTGRAILEELIEGHRRQAAIAEYEAELYSKRGEIIARQLDVTKQQLDDIQKLVEQGLSRRETLVGLKLDVDDYTSDEYEAAALEARAKQTAVNAENEIVVAEVQYYRDLLSAKLEVDQRIALIQYDLDGAMNYLQVAAPATAQNVTAQFETVFEIYRAGSSGPPQRVELTDRIQPDDVLMIRFQGVAN